MKVILLSDVPKIGRRYDVKEVSDGYGRNFLLKNKLAEIATPDIIKKIESNRIKAEEEKKKKESFVINKINELPETGLSLEAEANKEGNLFAGIRKEDIITVLRNNGAGILEEYLLFDKPIKESGEKELNFKVNGKNFKIKLKIVPIK